MQRSSQKHYEDLHYDESVQAESESASSSDGQLRFILLPLSANGKISASALTSSSRHFWLFSSLFSALTVSFRDLVSRSTQQMACSRATSFR